MDAHSKLRTYLTDPYKLQGANFIACFLVLIMLYSIGLLGDPRGKIRPVLSDFPFSVDTFNSLSALKMQFVTHAHKDHLQDIQKYPSVKSIWCTPRTKGLITSKYPKLLIQNLTFVTIEVGDDMELTHAPSWRVCILDSNHCPGSVMYLFYGPPGCTILHTGDCRFTPELLKGVESELDRVGRKSIDLLYLDCTFADKALVFPPLQVSLHAVVDLIQSELERGQVEHFYIACEMLGTEEVIEALHSSLGLPLHLSTPLQAASGDVTCRAGAPVSNIAASVSRTFKTRELQVERYNELLSLLPKGMLITDDGRSRDCADRSISTPLHLIGGDSMVDFTIHLNKVHPKGSFMVIKPSAQKIVLAQARGCVSARHGCHVDPAISQPAAPHTSSCVLQQGDTVGLWHVLYSRHSSQEELRVAMSTLRPRAMLPFSGNAPAELLALALSPEPSFVLDAIQSTLTGIEGICMNIKEMVNKRDGVAESHHRKRISLEIQCSEARNTQNSCTVLGQSDTSVKEDGLHYGAQSIVPLPKYERGGKKRCFWSLSSILQQDEMNVPALACSGQHAAVPDNETELCLSSAGQSSAGYLMQNAPDSAMVSIQPDGEEGKRVLFHHSALQVDRESDCVSKVEILHHCSESCDLSTGKENISDESSGADLACTVPYLEGNPHILEGKAPIQSSGAVEADVEASSTDMPCTRADPHTVDQNDMQRVYMMKHSLGADSNVQVYVSAILNSSSDKMAKIQKLLQKLS
ncbi:hypothetical protein CEUSTIGMA_g6179.t1 [Chlamydomonas eustigma]|uniref:DNA repair metallo-beta-lactamase domain-containing protein n=1 Tax=Chlamydomonas eustigma TaxID=1157962 RepID=A0A250X775_9CHLO|nr:hypothetical protein CEUSTIGMA_g6179.t1 [Chlamydomonas eustigma]|eukprot:GAX78742.1 hypothetical protein CEUSTIGMA_g6179.t1 [Chlamydomonas eustigma]